jgi:hypothetical protein
MCCKNTLLPGNSGCLQKGPDLGDRVWIGLGAVILSVLPDSNSPNADPNATWPPLDDLEAGGLARDDRLAR